MTWLPKSVVCLRYYDRSRFRSDAFAGFLLSLQIFPFAIAIAVAIGVHPFYGISCAAVAGLLGSIVGDSKIRVSAPNIILVSVASTVVAREGIVGLCLSTLLAGLLLMFFAAIRLGAAIHGLPRSVVVGFTTGIAVLVVGAQLPNCFGLNLEMPTDQVARGALTVIRHTTHGEPQSLALAFAALVTVVVCGKTKRHAPVPLIVVAIGTLLTRVWHLRVHTVGALYGSTPLFPMHLTGVLAFDSFGRIIGPAFAIAVLVAVESLRTMGVATGLTGESTNPNAELVLQGSANLASAFVGGLPVSGTCPDTLENARLGAQTPVAGMLQAVFLVAFLILLAPAARFIPLPLISALILSRVFGMTNWGDVLCLLKGPRFELVTWGAISVFTILADPPIAIAVGMFIGMFLYIRNLQQPARARLVARLTLW
jgi:SulP family sulfate permease